jgi:hypothetical protein
MQASKLILHNSKTRVIKSFNFFLRKLKKIVFLINYLFLWKINIE